MIRREYIYRIIEPDSLGYSTDWRQNDDMTILDALMTILFHTVGKPCLEGGFTISPNHFFESITTEESVIINLAEREGQMHITRDEGNLVTFGTDREVYGVPSPTCRADLRDGHILDCETYVWSKGRIEYVKMDAKQVAENMLWSLVRLWETGFDHRKKFGGDEEEDEECESDEDDYEEDEDEGDESD